MTITESPVYDISCCINYVVKFLLILCTGCICAFIADNIHRLETCLEDLHNAWKQDLEKQPGGVLFESVPRSTSRQRKV